MAKRLLFAVLLFIASPSLAQDLPGLVLPQSAAAVSDISALEINPAGLAGGPSFEMLYGHRNRKTFSGDDLYALRMGFLAFEVADLNHLALFKGTQTRTGLAFKVGKTGRLAVGGRYSKINAKGNPYDAARFWDLGLMLHWSRALSFGAVAKNLNRPKIFNQQIRQSYVAATAVRPIGERLTLGFDFEQSQKQKFDRGSYRFTGDFEVKPGLRLFGNLDRTKSFGFGLQIGLGNLALRNHNFLDKDGRYASSANLIYLSSNHLGNLLPPAHKGLVVKLSGDFPEEPNYLFGLWRTTPTTFLELMQGFAEARKDSKIEGLVLKLGVLDFGFARLQEVATEIKTFRSSGKKVIAYLEATGNAQYYLASQADYVAMPPVATLNFTGLRMERTFHKGTLDKLGIQADFIQRGKYKSAPEVLTRSGMSEPAREEANSLLDELFNQLVSAVAAGRKLPSDSVKKLIDRSPLVSDEARAAGLIDTALYANQLEAYARTIFDRKLFWTSLDSYINPPPSIPPWTPYPEVAVVEATGAIVEGPSRRDWLFGGRTLGSETMQKTLEQVSQSPNVKAIVLRIDSPGGTVQGSDLIWKTLKEAAAQKPLVVSMGDLAASGGYYITTPVREDILASPGTITGSIGVFTGKLVLSGFYEKIGRTKEILSRGQNADLGGTTHPFSPEQRKLVENQIDRAYRHFLSLVAEGRGKTVGQVDSVAQGRVWTGSQALSAGLVDRMGGLNDAVGLARQKAGLNPKEKVYLRSYPKPGTGSNTSSTMLAAGPTIALVDEKEFQSGEVIQDYLFAPQVLELVGRPVLNTALLERGTSWLLENGLQPPGLKAPKLFARLTEPIRQTFSELFKNLLSREEKPF